MSVLRRIFRQQNSEIYAKSGTEVPPFYVPAPFLIRGDFLLSHHCTDFMHGMLEKERGKVRVAFTVPW